MIAGDKCPGETECPRFGAAGGEGVDYAEQVKACNSCSLLPTKPKTTGAKPIDIDSEINALTDTIEGLTIERQAGYEPELASLSPLEFRGLVEWTACEIAYRRHHEAQVSSLFYALLKR